MRTSSRTDLWLLSAALDIANRATIADIETNAVRVDRGDGRRWYDTRPMLDAREHCGRVIDLGREAIDYAVTSGLVLQSAEQPHLLCVLHTP